MRTDGGLMRFGEFALDPANRRLTRGEISIDLGGRYLDALILLVSEQGKLVTKDRLHDEVWRGVPVTDEAISQAIMAMRKALGDDAGRPRFIETVPRYGYRFVADLTGPEVLVLEAGAQSEPASDATLRLVGGGIAGAATAGAVVGLVYGSMAAVQGAGSALSLLLVLMCVSIFAALVSGIGIAGGIGLFSRAGKFDWWRPIAGGGLGGLAIGGLAHLVGLDALRLLFGVAPATITGAGEGLAIGMAVGLALWLVGRPAPGKPAAHLGVSALVGAVAGLIIVILGGTLMAGSLATLIASFPAAALPRDFIPSGIWLLASGAFEGAIFSTGTVAGMMGWRR